MRLPVFLGRFPAEPTDSELAAFHEVLMAALRDPTFHHGRWQLCERSGWEGDDRYQNLVAWSWEGESRWLVVVNLSGAAATALVRTPWDDCRGRMCRLVDPTNDVVYERAASLAIALATSAGLWEADDAD